MLETYYLIQCVIYRPLLKLVDKLLLVGVLQDEDVSKLLIMIDPETWDSEFDKGKMVTLFFLNAYFWRKKMSY